MQTPISRTSEGNAYVTRRIGDETLIVPVTGRVGDLDAIYTLNEVGSFVWDLIDGTRTATAIVDALVAAYDVSPEAATRDVSELLAVLRAKGLVSA